MKLFQKIKIQAFNFFYRDHLKSRTIYRVSFLTGPAQKSSKYGTGPTQ